MNIQNMTYAVKERIGEPSLFCGRKMEMELLLNWAENIPREISKSRALLGRRKSGKTALMQRIFNILWNMHGRVIPFYIEIQQTDRWLLDFADDYFRTFLSQYLSFLTRTRLNPDNTPWDMDELERMAENIGNENILKGIRSFQMYYEAERVDNTMTHAFGAPVRFAGHDNVFFLVMIDEIQYMTEHIFWDKEHKVKASSLPGAYHGLVEIKTAPMLVSGSYVGWMTQMMQELFVGGRLKQTPISSELIAEDGMEVVYRYAEYYRQPVADEAAYVINMLTRSDPFYIAALFRSDWPDRDFTTVEGAVRTLAHEIRNRKGEIFGTWSEYINSTISKVNDRHSKKILLFLSKERHKECTRDEIREHLKNELDDRELERRLGTLERGDLIAKGTSNFHYKGIPDDILDMIFRELYQVEIDQIRPDIESDLAARVRKLEKREKSLKGALNELKGRMLEFIVFRELNRYRKEGKKLKNLEQRLRPLPENVNAGNMKKTLSAACIASFGSVWMNYYIQTPGTAAHEIDVLAETEDGETCGTLVFEMKNREDLPSLADAKLFAGNICMLREQIKQKRKKISFVCPVYLSAEGFEPDTEAWLHEHGIFTADMETWTRS
ncbi:MAG: hypothetical protein GY749_12120 [Desulfobacteraceae bacterium]|nr:hypothetical protein [Desulfobacteraceae bacterium]